MIKEEIMKPKDKTTMINLSEESIKKINLSECKNCYNVETCFLNGKNLERCKNFIDKKYLSQ